jgi:hypothetical protein
MKSSSITLLHLDAPYRKLREGGGGVGAPASATAAAGSTSGSGGAAAALAASASAGGAAAGGAPDAATAADAAASAATSEAPRGGPPSSSPTAAAAAGGPPKPADDNVHYIINLIDSPGHVDFSRYATGHPAGGGAMVRGGSNPCTSPCWVCCWLWLRQRCCDRVPAVRRRPGGGGRAGGCVQSNPCSAAPGLVGQPPPLPHPQQD